MQHQCWKIQPFMHLDGSGHLGRFRRDYSKDQVRPAVMLVRYVSAFLSSGSGCRSCKAPQSDVRSISDIPGLVRCRAQTACSSAVLEERSIEDSGMSFERHHTSDGEG